MTIESVAVVTLPKVGNEHIEIEINNTEQESNIKKMIRSFFSVRNISYAALGLLGTGGIGAGLVTSLYGGNNNTINDTNGLTLPYPVIPIDGLLNASNQIPINQPYNSSNGFLEDLIRNITLGVIKKINEG